MSDDESWVVASRAESLAKLLLTERDDLQVLQPSFGFLGAAYDYLVRVAGRDATPAPEFAVEVKGVRGPADPEQIRSFIERSPGLVHPLDLPLCLFVFDVDSRTGWFRWLVEPVVDAAGVGALTRTVVPRRSADRPARDPGGQALWHGYERLDRDALDRIVEQAVRWSRAFKRVLAS